ncbi:MAG: citrate transporter, partial [Bacillota bacterium]
MIAQIAAVLIFLSMFTLIIMEKIERHIVTLGCGLLTLVLVFGVCMRSKEAVLEALSLHSLFHLGFWYQTGTETISNGINWETI